MTPLIAAAFKGNDRIVEMLLARGAKVNVRDKTGKSAMVYAAARGFDDIVKRLLDAGVDARERYGSELTALMWAAGTTRVSVLRLSGASSICCWRTVLPSTTPTTAAAPR